jgi:hypothetical protein
VSHLDDGKKNIDNGGRGRGLLMKQNKTKQNKTKQNKTKQNKTKQNKTKQNKTKSGEKSTCTKSLEDARGYTFPFFAHEGFEGRTFQDSLSNLVPLPTKKGVRARVRV